MPDTHTLKLFAAHCRILANEAPTLAGKDTYLDMAIEYECQAEGQAANDDRPAATASASALR